MSIAHRYPTITQAALHVIARKGYHQASIREIARAAELSLAGLYHYVGSKDELLFLVIDQALDSLLGKLDAALAEAVTPETRLLALIRTHLEFAFHNGAALKVINRDVEVLADAHRMAATQKRQSYLLRGLEILRALDTAGRSNEELLSATNLLLGMLNGIATRPFVGQGRGVEALTGEVGRLFLHGFLGTGERDGQNAMAGPEIERTSHAAREPAGAGVATARVPAPGDIGEKHEG